MSLKSGNVRWAFDVHAWRCTMNDLELAVSCIQPEEKERLAKFVYFDDFKSSIIGRLLMRKFMKSCLPELDYSAIHFERDSRGKPFYSPRTEQFGHIDFNVSHHERYTVLAGSFSKDLHKQHLGVDVMKMEYSGGKPLNEFFRIMQRSFTPNEWSFIKSRDSEENQTAAFMRHWCLKESYVKNIGVGITINLQKIDFQLNTECLTKDNIVRNSVVSVDGEISNDWIFEESLLDDDYCVAVAMKNTSSAYNEITPTELRFEKIDFERLMHNAKPLLPVDSPYCQDIIAKELKKKLDNV